MTACVYVMEAAGKIKIGMAANPTERLKAFQAASPDRVTLLHATEARGDAKLVEMVAHKLLADQRLYGEWFDATAEDGICVVNRAIDLVDSGQEVRPNDSFTLRMKVSTRETLERLAKADGRTLSNYLNWLIDKHVAEKSKVVDLSRRRK